MLLYYNRHLWPVFQKYLNALEKVYSSNSFFCCVIASTVLTVPHPACIFKAVPARVPHCNYNLGVMANVELMSPFQKALFKFAYHYKTRQVAMGRDTPILNALIFKKTAALLGGKMRAMLSGGAPLEEKTQRFMEVCIKTPCVIGYVCVI